MDWGLALVIVAVVFLVGHMALDMRALARNLRRIDHDPNVASPIECERCRARFRGEQELRHEATWTAAAVVVLAIHITLDFVA